MDEDFRKAALDYHRLPQPGKIAVEPTKRWPTSATWRSPIRRAWPPPAWRSSPIPASARDYTARGNLVGVITNGTAVLGLGNIGPLAGKPVMEGKAVLFKKFAGIDVFDIEVDERDPDKAGRHHRGAGADLRRHQPRGHQGAGMLRDRGKAAPAHEDPGLPRRPARHRDHRRRGGAQRARARQGKALDEVKLVTSGAGAAALACLDLLVAMGLQAGEHHADRHQGRGLRRPRPTRRCDPTWRATRSRPTRARCRTCWRARTCSSACRRRGVLKPEMAGAMAREAADPGAGQPRAGDPARAGERGAAGRHHRHRPHATIPTRSTTSCAFPSSSAARSMSAPRRSTRR